MLKDERDVKSSQEVVKSEQEVFKCSNLTLQKFLDSQPDPNERRRIDIDVYLLENLTTKIQSFIRTSNLVDDCIQSETNFPYPDEEIKKLFVRTCYRDVFDKLLVEITSGKKRFAISGTPGIGKSLFFVYILYRLVKDLDEKSLSLKPKSVIYQARASFKLFDLEHSRVYRVKSRFAENLVQDSETFYIIDKRDSQPLQATCIILFISSPRQESYEHFVKKKVTMQFFFPVWTLNELQLCHNRVYPELPSDLLAEQFRIYGGVARFCFRSCLDGFMDEMEKTLNDVNAVAWIRNVGRQTREFHTSHTLLHAIVSENYRFQYIDLASKYVGEQLWILYHAQMITNLQELFGGAPSELSGHLFEIYGHLVFEVGKVKLRCRDLEGESQIPFDLELNSIAGSQISFGKGSIPKKPIEDCYYKPDDNIFPAIDSFSRQGMFQFTVAAKHPIRGVMILKQVCKLFDEPKLYFVVPVHRFEKFQKQKFLNVKGNAEVKAVEGLKQYVLELPVRSLVKV